MSTEEISEAKKPLRRFAVSLRKEREQRAWTQSQLAESIGTTQTTVSLWERDLTVPGPYFKQRLQELFGKSLQELGLLEEEQESAGQETSESPPLVAQPVSNIPYRRNPLFTGREDILAKLEAMLGAGKMAALTRMQAISGLGGIGKTQIAVEYAYRHLHDYTAILWATAPSHETLAVAFTSIAKLLGLRQQDESDQNILVAIVKRWLATHTSWLLILDNVDADVLALIDEFLPRQSQGVVLLTTRSQAVGAIPKSIEVEKMGKDEGMLLLLRRAKLLAADETLEQAAMEIQSLAAAIVTVLGGLPLALDQAGAYIEETHCSLQRYLTLYETHHKALLERRGVLSIDHPEPVTATWLLSLQQIEQNNPPAVALLHLCAFLSAEAIPEAWIVDGAAELGSVLGPVAAHPLEFDVAIGTLFRYSLIQRDPEERALSMHRLVQTVIRDATAEQLRPAWAERVVRLLNRIFPRVEPATWDACQKCLPHAQIAAGYIEKYGFNFSEAAHLLNQVAVYLMDHAQYNQVEPLLQRALAIRQQRQESEHSATATTLNDLGKLYYLQGKYRQAEQLLQQAFALREQLLGEEHSDTAVTLNNLALLHNALGKYDRAEELFTRALHIQQLVFKDDHADIEQTHVHLAEAYTAKGKYDQAEQLYRQILANQKQRFGPEHPIVAKTLNNLASVYRSKGEYSRSEELFWRALSIQQSIWGEDHPDVAQTLNNLARLYRAQGKYAESAPYYEQALLIREQVFGPDNLHVAESLSSIAKLSYSQGKYAQAGSLCRQALQIQEQGVGDNHPIIANTLIIFGKIYLVQGEYEQAEKQYRRALAIREEALEPEHPHVAVIISCLAETYQAQGRYEDALPLITRSLKIREEALGPGHPYFAYSLSNLAENFFLRGEYVQAEPSYQQALTIREKVLGPLHPLTASTYHHLAKLFLVQGRYAEAKTFCKKALDAREQKLDPVHPDVAASRELYKELLHIDTETIYNG